MSQSDPTPPKLHFVRTFIFPALFVFLVPVLSYFFFRHAQSHFDNQFRESVLNQIRADQRLTAEQRTRGEEFFTEVPLSRMLAEGNPPFEIPPDTRFYYETFRWMIVVSAVSILAGVGVFLVGGVCVALSLHSQYVQYLSLSVGWHVLKIFGALQTAAQGVLLVALSFWVTALWFNFYSLKLVGIAGFLAVGAVCCVIAVIFQRVKDDFSVVGRVLGRDEAEPLWDELGRICAQVGTAPPDQIIVGIDDNFFVTEHPVTVEDTVYRGRTLFVSLSVLKQLQGGEADAVLAHEMAHFSGQDTLYSRKIGPLLNRYGLYLNALRNGGATLPVYYFMLCFWALYQLSVNRLSRQREFRADQIAVETTSARDAAGALLRIVAYSKYRRDVERDLLEHERRLESANVSERVEVGFHQYATSFVSGPDIGQLASAHPFDSHPPLAERLRAVGVPLDSEEARTLLATAGDGKWYRLVPTAEQIEKEYWGRYEEGFRMYHDLALAYRFLPASPEENEIVVKAFPPLTFAGSKGVLTLDHEQIGYDEWPEPIRFAQVTGFTLDNNVLKVMYHHGSPRVQTVKVSTFADRKAVIDAINRYYGRHMAAAAYQRQKREREEFGDLAGFSN